MTRGNHRPVDGRLICVSGASRSGKTAHVIQETASAKRLIAWDPEDQLWRDAGMRRVTTLIAMLRAMSNAGGGPLRLSYVPSAVTKERHSTWAAAVLDWSRETGGCEVIAEELSDVSSPGKASEGWGQLVRRGLKRGITIYAISQRWQEADKTVTGNAGEFRIFRQSTRADVDYMASRVDVPGDVIAGLDRLEYVAYDAVTKGYELKKVVFGSGKR